MKNGHFDILVIGSGPGGYVAALKAAQMGASAAVVEHHHLGGTCLNYGCIPSKALLSSAEMLHSVQNAKQWGVTVDGKIGFDWKEIVGHKNKVLRQLRGGIASLFKRRGVELLEGRGSFEAAGRVRVTPADGPPQTVTAGKVIIATGSAPIRIPGWPDDPALVCTSDEAVHWTALPGKLLIVGGGVIGCEFACMMRAFGVDVTVVEMMPGLLPTLDHELGKAMLAVFKSRGIVCHLDTKVESVDAASANGLVTARLSGGEELAVDRILVATGRRPNTEGLELASAGIRADNRGFVPVNDQLETNVRGHYGIGDVNGRCMLAHAASAHGVAAVENALGHAKPFHSPIPSAVYTFPEVAAVGLSEQEAKDQGLPIAIGRFPIGHLGKAMAARHTDGFVKMIRHRETGALLGAHMIGQNATECIAATTALLHKKASMLDVAETVWAHPTISESIKESAEDALNAGLHLPPRKIIRVPAGV
ncbi:MAG: dihydrolipoyl dehydrogenase [Thermoguttaceae bacterium]|jgi:dihydrolipoamide dehydrogenase|nr:dihydrolipoyl dehydrogenase [Thermoguttaceae bacterium]